MGGLALGILGAACLAVLLWILNELCRGRVETMLEQGSGAIERCPAKLDPIRIPTRPVDYPLVDGQVLACELAAGHKGWHQSAGCQWTALDEEQGR